MALPFENGNYFLHNLGSVLENKTIIKVQVYGNLYSMKYIGKTTDTFWWLKLHKPYRYKAKVMLQVEQITPELLMLVSDFNVNSRLKNTH